MNRSELPARLHACWDDGRDPLDDPEIRDWLLEHPEQLESFATLNASLDILAERPRRRFRVAAAAAVIAIGAGTLIAWPTSEPSIPWPEFATRGRVIEHAVDTRPPAFASWSRSERGHLVERAAQSATYLTAPPSPRCSALEIEHRIERTVPNRSVSQ